MRRVLKKAGAAVIAMMLCLSLFVVAAYAEEGSTDSTANGLSVEIPFTIELSGFLPSLDTGYTVELKAADAAAPMPEGSADGVYSMTVAEAGSYTFPAIFYPRVGIHKYTIQQLAGSDSFGVYDTAVFDVTVYITNKEDGNGLEMTVIAYRQEEGAEKSDIVIKNFYKTPVNVTAVKQWNTISETHPDSVTVNLLKDGEVYDTVVLNEENDWQNAWNRLSDEFTWTVEEVEVPEGYEVSYATEGEVTTITNTELPPEHYYDETETETETELEETGDGEGSGSGTDGKDGVSTGDSTPIMVYVMLALGALMVMAATGMRRRRG